MITKRDTKKLYNLPDEVKYCTKCTVSNQRPRISFDEHGVCSACNYAHVKQNEIDWEQREQELIALCDKHRRTDGRHDVIVPCSGGKDGSFVAHQLKYKYGMNPLCVTWAPLVPTEIGKQNLDSFVASGFDHIIGKANPIVSRKLTQLAFKEMGDPFQPFIYGQMNFPLRTAVQYDIPLVMYGENGEAEYGGCMKSAFSPQRELKDYNAYYFSGKPPEFWMEHGLTLNDLEMFKGPSREAREKVGLELHFFGYYKYWDPQDNFYYAREHCDFKTNRERSEGTYSKYASLDDKIDGFHYYLSYIKFGLGRTTSDSAHEIRDNRITREEGIALVNKYDGEFPQKHYELFLEYCDISEEEFNQVIDSWRSDHLWEKVDGEWKLKSVVS